MHPGARLWELCHLDMSRNCTIRDHLCPRARRTQYRIAERGLRSQQVRGSAAQSTQVPQTPDPTVSGAYWKASFR